MKINTINDLVKAITNKNHGENILDIMSRVDIDMREYEKFFTWHEDHYTRNCLMKSRDYELLLVCYEPGQQTKIHNYNVTDVWVHPVLGMLKEERFRKASGISGLEKLSDVTLDASEYSFVCENIGIHRYSNIHLGRSATLNFYSKPIDQWNVYDEITGDSYLEEAKRHSMYY